MDCFAAGMYLTDLSFLHILSPRGHSAQVSERGRGRRGRSERGGGGVVRVGKR